MPEEKKYTVDELADRIKTKYPEYEDIDNTELVEKVTSKYPEYNDVLKKKTVESCLQVADHHLEKLKHQRLPILSRLVQLCREAYLALVRSN